MRSRRGHAPGADRRSGSRDEIIHAPKHEYTRTLLAAVPVPEPRRAGGRGVARSPASPGVRRFFLGVSRVESVEAGPATRKVVQSLISPARRARDRSRSRACSSRGRPIPSSGSRGAARRATSVKTLCRVPGRGAGRTKRSSRYRPGRPVQVVVHEEGEARTVWWPGRRLRPSASSPMRHSATGPEQGRVAECAGRPGACRCISEEARVEEVPVATSKRRAHLGQNASSRMRARIWGTSAGSRRIQVGARPRGRCGHTSVAGRAACGTRVAAPGNEQRAGAGIARMLSTPIWATMLLQPVTDGEVAYGCISAGFIMKVLKSPGLKTGHAGGGDGEDGGVPLAVGGREKPVAAAGSRRSPARSCSERDADRERLRREVAGRSAPRSAGGDVVAQPLAAVEHGEPPAAGRTVGGHHHEPVASAPSGPPSVISRAAARARYPSPAWWNPGSRRLVDHDAAGVGTVIQAAVTAASSHGVFDRALRARWNIGTPFSCGAERGCGAPAERGAGGEQIDHKRCVIKPCSIGFARLRKFRNRRIVQASVGVQTCRVTRRRYVHIEAAACEQPVDAHAVRSSTRPGWPGDFRWAITDDKVRDGSIVGMMRLLDLAAARRRVGATAAARSMGVRGWSTKCRGDDLAPARFDALTRVWSRATVRPRAFSGVRRRQWIRRSDGGRRTGRGLQLGRVTGHGHSMLAALWFEDQAGAGLGGAGEQTRRNPVAGETSGLLLDTPAMSGSGEHDAQPIPGPRVPGPSARILAALRRPMRTWTGGSRASGVTAAMIAPGATSRRGVRAGWDRRRVCVAWGRAWFRAGWWASGQCSRSDQADPESSGGLSCLLAAGRRRRS